MDADGNFDLSKRLRERYHPIIHAIRDMPKPVVSAVNGPAAGIGCSLALSADLIVAAHSSFFLLAFVNIGLVPDGGSTAFVPARIGLARAAEMMMLGERVSAQKALEWGLVNTVVPDESLHSASPRARRAPGEGPDPLLRGRQGASQPPRLRGPRRSARGRGGPTARHGQVPGLHRGSHGIRPEARTGVQGQLSASQNNTAQLDAWAWQVLRPLLDGRPYLPWTEGAIRPAALVAVLNEIAFAERRRIVELGSGVSSIVIGRLLAERGGKLTAVEHDPDWAALVRRQVEREHLQDCRRGGRLLARAARRRAGRAHRGTRANRSRFCPAASACS